jgi:PAS domain S-box-containing protein
MRVEIGGLKHAVTRLCSTAQPSNFLLRYGLGTMTTRRSSGPQAHATKTALTQPTETLPSAYSAIFNSLPLGVAILQLQGSQGPRTFRILDLNPAAARLTGSSLEDVRGRTLEEFPSLLKTEFANRCLEALRSRTPKDLGDISCGGDRIRHGTYSVRVFPLSENLLGVAFENVSDRRRAVQDLFESGEERFRQLVQAVQEYAIFHLDPLGNVVSWNVGAQQMKGYRAEEILGKHFSVFYPPEEVSIGKPQHILKEAERRGQIEDEGWRIRKDGSRFWANVVVTPLRNADGSLQGFAKITRDRTERHASEETLAKAKELLELRIEQRTTVLARVNMELRTEIAERVSAEEQLRASRDQLRALAAQLQSVREAERASIAREIHDELGQACTAIKMDLALISHKTDKSQTSLRRKVDATIQLVDGMIVTLRRIASDLRPRTLDDLGLTAALEWQAQEFEKRTGISCRVTLPQEPLVLDADRSTAIFRIFQESLTNVARHSQASQVVARLEKSGDQLLLHVQDNGVGFDLEEVKTRRSLGLVGMRERALLLNGELNVAGVRGSGTTMTLRIPLASTTLPAQDSR